MRSRYNLTLIIVLFSILVIPAVSASTLYNTWIYSADTFEKDDTIFRITLSKGWEKILVEMDSDSLIIPLGECGSNGIYHACFEEVLLDLANNHGKIDYDTGKEIPHIKLFLEKVEPKIKLIRDFALKKPLIGETFQIVATIKNTGDKMAEGAYYIEELPEQVKITYASEEIQVVGNSIRWNGNIPPNYEQKLFYQIKFLDDYEEYVYANITYTYEDISQEVSAKKKYQTYNRINIKPTFKPTKVEPGEQATLTIKIKNDGTSTMKLNDFKINIPNHIQFVRSSPLLRLEDGDYHWSASIGVGQTKTLELVLMPTFTGKHNISIFADATFGSEREQREKIDDMNVQIIKLTPKIEFMFDDTRLKTGDESNIRLTLGNRNDFTLFRYVRYEFWNDLLPDSISLYTDFLERDGKTIIYEREFDAPYVDKKTIYNFNFTGEYESVYGESWVFNTKNKLTVEQGIINKSVIIKYSRPSKMLSNETAQVSVTVQNKYDKRLKIEMREILPDNIEVEGETYRLLPVLEPREKRTMYIYKITPTEDFNESKIEIKTWVNVLGEGSSNIWKESTDINVEIVEEVIREKEEEIDVKTTTGNGKTTDTGKTSTGGIGGSISTLFAQPISFDAQKLMIITGIFLIVILFMLFVIRKKKESTAEDELYGYEENLEI